MFECNIQQLKFSMNHADLTPIKHTVTLIYSLTVCLIGVKSAGFIENDSNE